MEIDEKWVGKTAGWKALKVGRDLVKMGAVEESAEKGNIISGLVKGGGKPARVTVKINGVTDVETVCPKFECRTKGEVCGHAVAVLLHHIRGLNDVVVEKKQSQESGAMPDIVVEPVEVLLPPQFPDGLPDGGVSVRLKKRELAEDVQATANDVKLAVWLEKVTGKAFAGMFGLRGKQALEFLDVLAEHLHIVSGEKKVQIAKRGVRMPMTLTRDEDRMELRLAEQVLEHGRVWYGDGKMWLWDEGQKILVLLDVSKLWKERNWQRLAAGNSIFLTMKEFLKSSQQREDLIVWENEDGLAEIPVRAGEPKIMLQIDGSTNMLQASLVAKYSDEVKVKIGLMQHEEVGFPLPDSEVKDGWIERNKEAEDLAAGVLLDAGFQIVDAAGGWQMSDGDAILDFLTSVYPELDERWEVTAGNKLRTVKGNLVRITPSIEVQGTGEDWLAFDYGFQTDAGKEIPREVIAKMLTTGKRSGTTKNGKQVVISSFDAEIMETVLRDTNPRQEQGKYYVAKHQAAYLRRLRNYYQGGGISLTDKACVNQLPESIQQTLREYQEEGIAWIYERAKQEGAALLADDMGLGKTLQTLSFIHLWRQEHKAPALVVCPTSLLGNWKEEVEKFFPDMNVLVLHGSKRKDFFDVAHAADIVITSYALIGRDIDFYAKQTFSSLVIDEASMIRNPDTQAAKALRKLNAESRIALTGTPVENAVRDLWSLYQFLLPNYLGTREDFKRHYEQPLSGRLTDTGVMKRLRMRVEPFMLRRTKAKVAKDLPPKMGQILWCDASPLQKNSYADILRQGASKVDSMEGGAARMQMLTVLLRLRQASCDLRLLDSEITGDLADVSGKLVRLLELLDEAKRGGHRVLVFSQFTTMLALIKDVLGENDISFAYLDGATRDRAGEVRKFQDANGPDVFLISLKAGGYGLNLTAADTVVHFDPWWNPAVEAQATDRAYRIGQTRPTTVYKMITRGTVEEKIVRLQDKKRGLIGAAIGDEAQPMMGGLTEADMRDLIG